MKLYNQVFENNRKWVADRRAKDPRFFEKLARDQHPDFLYIGCSDSRIPANEIMGLEPGDVFVHRNIGNLVVNTDINAHAVIQYAVESLHVKHIIVCGHYGCGGVKASLTHRDLGLINKWLREIRDVYRMHKEELNAIRDEKARLDRLVELNVREQCFNVIKSSWVQKSYLTTGYPTVHGWVYDLGNGLLKDLNIDFPGMLKTVREIYDLGQG